MSETSQLLPILSSSGEDDSDDEPIEEISFPTSKEMYHAFLVIEDRMGEKIDKLPVIRTRTASLFCVFCFIFHSNLSHACESLNEAERVANRRLSQLLEGHDTFEKKLYNRLMKFVKTEGEKYANELAGKKVSDVSVEKRSVTPNTTRIVSRKRNVSSRSSIQTHNRETERFSIDSSTYTSSGRLVKPVVSSTSIASSERKRAPKRREILPEAPEYLETANRRAGFKRPGSDFVPPSLPEDKSEWTREHYKMEAWGPEYMALQAFKPEYLKDSSSKLIDETIYESDDDNDEKKKGKGYSKNDAITIDSDESEKEEEPEEEAEGEDSEDEEY